MACAGRPPAREDSPLNSFVRTCRRKFQRVVLLQLTPRKYLMQRIPEIADVDVEDPDDLIDEGTISTSSLALTGKFRRQP